MQAEQLEPAELVGVAAPLPEYPALHWLHTLLDAVLVWPVAQAVHAVAAEVASVPPMFVYDPVAQLMHEVGPGVD